MKYENLTVSANKQERKIHMCWVLEQVVYVVIIELYNLKGLRRLYIKDSLKHAVVL
jgi:hypothetical protein